MPWKDREVGLQYLKEYRRKHQEVRNKEHAARGLHTKESLAWPRADLTEGQRMWMAAVIDCEGCLTMTSVYNKKRGGYNFSSFTQVSMTKIELLERIKEICAGNICAQAYRYKTRKQNNDLWTWQLSANGLRWLLPQIVDHLILKKRQAILLMEFLTICKRGISKRSSMNERAQEIRAEMAILNYRGRWPGEGKSTEPLSIPNPYSTATPFQPTTEEAPRHA